MAELVDAGHSKCSAGKPVCGFESHSGHYLTYNMGVAQLVVHGTPNPEVEGSIPSTHAKYFTSKIVLIS